MLTLLSVDVGTLKLGDVFLSDSIIRVKCAHSILGEQFLHVLFLMERVEREKALQTLACAHEYLLCSSWVLLDKVSQIIDDILISHPYPGFCCIVSSEVRPSENRKILLGGALSEIAFKPFVLI
jgi:hypothetical protein